MTFLNAALLAGSAAAAVPLLIHLLHKSRIQTVRWGAMQLLAAGARTPHSRVRWHPSLLLLLRISIPALLALCMSRPLLQSVNAPGTRVKSATVLLLDDSASMQATHDGSSSFERAKAAAIRFIREQPAGSEFCLLALSNPERIIQPATTERQALDAPLRLLPPAAARAQIPAALAAAGSQMARMHLARRQVIVFSDFQSTTWAGAEDKARLDSAQMLQNLPLPPRLILFDTGSVPPENISLDPIALPQTPATTNQRVRFQTAIRNHGGTTRSAVRLVWRVDGKTVEQDTVDVPAHQHVQTALDWVFHERGSHFVEVLTDPDSIPTDNQRAAALEVHAPFSVLLVNGNPSPLPLEGETDFVETALHPDNSANPAANAAFNPLAIPFTDLNTRTLKDFSVVLLANTPPLDPAFTATLEDFVRSGGGLLFFPGLHTNPEWTNRELHREGRGLLPAATTAATNAISAPSAPGAPDPSLSELARAHPIFEPLDGKLSLLSGLHIERWFVLHSPASSEPRAFRVLARLPGGDPLWIEMDFGRGTVLQSAIPCTARWSNFPSRPSFVPLMRRFATHAAHRGTREQNVEVGHPFRWERPLSQPGDPLHIRRPDGSCLPLAGADGTPRAEILAGAQQSQEFVRTELPGIYTIESATGTPLHFAAYAPAAESDPARMTAEQVAGEAGRLGAVRVDSPESLLEACADSAQSQEIWPQLLLLLLAALFAEMLLQQRLQLQPASSR